MRRIIHNLRQQPEEMRRQVLHIIVGISGFILLALWVYSLGAGWRVDGEDNNEEAAQNPSPGLKAGALDGYESLNDF